MAPDGKAVEFFYPKTRYIWAMAFNSNGDLFVATGDKGEIHRVAPDGKGSAFFNTEDTHARSLAIDPEDNVLIGTGPVWPDPARFTLGKWVRFVSGREKGNHRSGRFAQRSHLCRRQWHQIAHHTRNASVHAPGRPTSRCRSGIGKAADIAIRHGSGSPHPGGRLRGVSDSGRWFAASGVVQPAGSGVHNRLRF